MIVAYAPNAPAVACVRYVALGLTQERLAEKHRDCLQEAIEMDRMSLSCGGS